MAEILDAAALANLRAMTGDDPTLYGELLDSFLEDADAQVADLRSPSGPDAVTRAAHSLKSNAMNVGATVLADLCRDLEVDSRLGAIAEVADRVDAITRELDGVRAAIVREREALPDA